MANWKHTIFVVCVAYAVAGFCQAMYVFLLGPTGHGGGGFDLVVTYFLAAPILAVRFVLKFGLNESIVLQLTIFLVAFFAVVGGAFWWSKREHVIKV
jgi:hypothetical protein